MVHHITRWGPRKPAAMDPEPQDDIEVVKEAEVFPAVPEVLPAVPMRKGDAQSKPRQRTTVNSNTAKRLSDTQKKMLGRKLHNKLETARDDLDLEYSPHAERPVSVLTAAVSGIVNYLLMFGLCAAYGLIMFSDEHNERHCPLAVKMNLGTAMISGLLVASFSKIKVGIGGPDLNPVVLLGTFVDSIQASIASQLDLELPSIGRRLGASGESSGEFFCSGEHLEDHLAECEAFHNELRATVIFATAASSLVFVVLFLIFGTFKFTRYVSYIPTAIVEAFLSCIGYKVFLYALKFCKYDPFQFFPAACIGVTLYFMKAYHMGHPGIVMPVGFLLPLGIFYAAVYGIMSSDIDSIRERKLMFPLMENVDFWHVWTDSIGKPQYINFEAWLTTLPDLAIMIIVVLLDCLLKIMGTESKLHMKVDRDYEVNLHGLGNIATTLTGSSVGYMQLKFNVINAGIMGNVKDRRGAMFYAALCAVCYFGTIAPINYMPRFFVGSLLFFAGSGFICENLWGSRKYLHPVEWIEVLIILAVFILTGQLLLAVIAGGCICSISFIVKYARVPSIDGKPMRGADLKIVERRGPLLLRNIRHITQSWLLAVRLKGFVFFASAQSLTAHVLSIISSEEEQDIPIYRRLRIVVFDCKLLDGVDASASKAFASFTRDAKEHKVCVLWSGLSKPFHEEFEARGVFLTDASVLADLEEAVMSVEDLAIRYLHSIEKQWMSLHHVFAENMAMSQARYRFEPFTQIFLSTTGRIGCPWQYCSKKTMEGHHTVLWTPGEVNGMLYLVHSGAVGLFKTLPEDDEHWGSPAAVYRHGWFLNRETIMRMPAKFYGVALEDGELLCWTQERWWAMACERPLMMAEILKAVMKQQARDCDAMEVFQSPTQAHMKETVDVDEAAWEGVEQEGSFSPNFSRQISRQTSGGSKDGNAVVRIVGDQFAELPEWLATRLQNLESASVLSGLKFYDPPPEGDVAKLPSLPALLRRDLEIAFSTYIDIVTGEIDGGRVSDALKFAGAFEVETSDWENESSYCKEDFMHIGHKVLMAPLCQRDLQTIETYFQKADEDGDGALNLHELSSFLHWTVSKHLHLDEVDGIASAWGHGDHGEISSTLHLDLQSINSVMSLFIRKHEHCWHMLQGFLQVLGTETIQETDVLTVQHLMTAKNVAISREQAEEMIWAANWRRGHDHADSLHSLPWTQFVSAVYLCSHRPNGPLPPTLQVGTTLCLQADMNDVVRAESAWSAWSNHQETPGSAAAILTDMLGTEHKQHSKSKASIKAGNSVYLSDMLDLSLSGEDPPSPTGDEPANPTARRTPGVAASVADGTGSLQTQMAVMLENPCCTALGRVAKGFGYLVIVASVLETVLEPFIAGSNDEQSETEKQLWFDLECSVTGIFTIEIILRLFLTNKKVVEWLMRIQAWCLILATLPLYLELLLGLVVDESLAAYRAVNLLRLARLARLSRLTHAHPAMEAIVVSLVVVWGIFKKHALDEPA